MLREEDIWERAATLDPGISTISRATDLGGARRKVIGDDVAAWPYGQPPVPAQRSRLVS